MFQMLLHLTPLVLSAEEATPILELVTQMRSRYKTEVQGFADISADTINTMPLEELRERVQASVKAKTAIRESYKNLDQSIYFLDRLVRCQKDAQLLFCMMWYLPPYKGTQSVMRISKSGQSSIVWESQRGRKGLFKKSLTDSEYAELKNGLKDLKLQQVLPLQRASENNLLVGITYYIGNDFHVYTFHDGVPRSLRTLLDVVTRKYSGVTPRSHVAPWYYEPGHER